MGGLCTTILQFTCVTHDMWLSVTHILLQLW